MRELKFLIPYVVFTSFSYFFAKDGLQYASPLAFMAFRYLIAGAILLAISRKLVLKMDVIYLTLFTVASTAFWIYGLAYVSPSQSAVLSYTMPLFSLPIAFLLVRESPSRMEVLGIVVGFAGVFIYGIPLVHGFTFLGMVLTIVNAVFWATFTVLYRRLREEEPISVNATQFVVGAAILFALSSFNFRVSFNLQFTEDLLWMATLGGALQFLLWNLMVRVSKVNRVTVLAFSVPIFTIVLEAVMNHSMPTYYGIAGVAVMFIGILISRLRGGISIVRPPQETVK
ncbi:EamA family transporter [Thermogymnomonas acidicola]|uniref:EamA family transporter n=1 Tax=Thermogymnomonas acidicola TaxID=399579 RepID=A0AA37BSJ6_9ARCH|nr:DMT family transporter [Thermogymnomonas acidicola]GGM78836.1 EamA family transporter [Thermogymnomonas acidicola]